ncbi:MAG: hypothetical protein QXT57_04785 [Thermosphaera sp.]
MGENGIIPGEAAPAPKIAEKSKCWNHDPQLRPPRTRHHPSLSSPWDAVSDIGRR